MANQEILTVSLKDYKKTIEDLRASLLNLDKDSQEYKDTVAEITKMQTNLDDALKAGKKNTDALSGSYQDIANTMSKLKAEWKATNDETKRMELGGKILELNNQLKDMDASIGNYQRNVGDYANAWTTAFQGAGGALGEVGGKAAGAIGGVKNLGTAFKALRSAMGPIGVILGIVTAAFSAISKGISGSEENTRKFQKVLTPFRATLDLISDGCSVLAGWFLDLVDVVGNLGSKFVEFYDTLPDWTKWMINPLGEAAKATGVLDAVTAKLTEKMEQENKVLAEQNKLTDMQRESKKELAEMSKEENELMEKYNDQTLDINKRIESLYKANKLREEQAEKRLELARQENLVLEEQAKLTDNDKEANDKLAEAQAKVIEAEANLAKVRSDNNKNLKQANEEQKKEIAALNNLEKERIDNENIYATYDQQYIKKRIESLDKAREKEIADLKNDVVFQKQSEEDKNKQLLAIDEKYYKEKWNNIYDYYSNFLDYRTQLYNRILIGQEESFGANSKQFLSKQISIGEESLGVLSGIINRFNEEIKSSSGDEGRQSMLNSMLESLKTEYVEQQHTLLQLKQKYNNEEIEGLQRYYETEIATVATNEEEVASLRLKSAEKTVEKVNEQIQRLKGDTEAFGGQSGIFDNFTIDGLIQFRPILDDGSVDTPALEEFMSIFKEMMLPDEDLDQFQMRLKSYVDNVIEQENRYSEFTNGAFQEIMDARKAYLQETIETPLFGSSVLDDLKQNVEEAKYQLLTMYQEVGESEESFNLRRLQAQKNYNTESQKLTKEYLKVGRDSAKAQAQVLDVVANAYQAKIERELESGKISEEEAEKQFKRVKAMQYAVTWINTLASIEQIMSDSSIPSYWVKVPLAAAQLAQGIATTAEIKNTELNGANTSSSALASSSLLGVTSANVQPVINEDADLARMTQIYAAPTYGQRVYILQSDIVDSNNQVEIREEQTTF